MMRNARVLVLIALLSGLLSSPDSSAQSFDDWRLSGQFFGDLEAMLAHPDEDVVGDNAFQIRRVFFTADAPLGESFQVRVRTETTTSSRTSNNRSATFMKDVYVRWNDVFGDGHRMVIGLSAPPMWQVSQRFWSYRSLARTIQHRAGIAGPRDTGVALYGPLGNDGNTRYGVMVGNNNQRFGDDDRAKKFYSQIDTRLSNGVIAAGGFDYHSLDDGQSFNGNLLLGLERETSRIAVEAFFNHRPMDDQDDSDHITGASVYGWHDLSSSRRLIGRVDLTQYRTSGQDVLETWAFVGFSYRPEEDVQIIPNLTYEKLDTDDDPMIRARITLFANF